MCKYVHVHIWYGCSLNKQAYKTIFIASILNSSRRTLYHSEELKKEIDSWRNARFYHIMMSTLFMMLRIQNGRTVFSSLSKLAFDKLAIRSTKKQQQLWVFGPNTLDRAHVFLSLLFVGLFVVLVVVSWIFLISFFYLLFILGSRLILSKAIQGIMVTVLRTASQWSVEGRGGAGRW